MFNLEEKQFSRKWSVVPVVLRGPGRECTGLFGIFPNSHCSLLFLSASFSEGSFFAFMVHRVGGKGPLTQCLSSWYPVTLSVFLSLSLHHQFPTILSEGPLIGPD